MPAAWLESRAAKVGALAIEGLLERQGDRIRATPAGWLVLDAMLPELVD